MKKNNDKILIVGFGSIGQRHFRNLKALGYADLVVCDALARREDLADVIGDLPFYRTMEAALAATKPDVVFVCTPTHQHIPDATRALEHSCHVFIEKPLSYSLAGIQSLMKLAARKKKTVIVACNFRFDQGWQFLYKALKSKCYGQPLQARLALGYYLPTARKNTNYKKIYAARRQGGGVILDSGSHAVDYLEALFGPVAIARAFRGTTRSINIQSEETAGLILQHASGLMTVIALDYVSHRAMHRLEILTDRGLLTWDFAANTVSFDDGTEVNLLYQGEEDVNRMFVDEIKHFFDCIKHNKKPAQDLAMARQVVAVLVRSVAHLK